MYKMNLFLKILITLLLTIVIILSNNYYVFWLLLLINIGLSIYKEDKITVTINLANLVVLFLSNYIKTFLLVFKLLFIINLVVSFLHFISEDEKKYIKSNYKGRRKNSLRIALYEKVFPKVLEKNKKKAKDIYGDNIDVDDKIEQDLERLYLQSRIRFYGFNNTYTLKWTYIDTLILFFSLVIFILLMIVR